MAKSENLLLSTVWGLRIEPVLISIMMIVTKMITKVKLSSPRACALRALGLLLADSALTVGWGKAF